MLSIILLIKLYFRHLNFLVLIFFNNVLKLHEIDLLMALLFG